VVAALSVLAAIGISAGAGIWWNLFAATGEGEITVEISSGETLRTISRTLKDAGLIRNALALQMYGRVTGQEGRAQAGRYEIARPVSPVQILDKIMNGDALPNEIVVTIPEGWTVNEIGTRFQANGMFSLEAFSLAATMRADYRGILFVDELPDGESLEGYVFPDSYRFFTDSTATEVIRLMLTRFRDQLPAARIGSEWREEMTVRELVVLASIVQREAAGTAEMAAIAGVFRNRLQIGMKLESDATLNYALGTSRRQPTFADTAVDHPYNTYVYRGLPPGPIGNPGLAALRAAATPASHDYLFFLHPLGGEAVFSRTYEEHLENKRRYLD
jgi:UPF0755 protein